eukprot:gb/GECG01015921.1/.p1 GENE.gb/GECG01015921.1/~~gb/GECG01015921.1/.p1  ORF type:complete len:100 (+),score=15.07 gb/GECG01015921.1/:1-300(+)
MASRNASAHTNTSEGTTQATVTTDTAFVSATSSVPRGNEMLAYDAALVPCNKAARTDGTENGSLSRGTKRQRQRQARGAQHQESVSEDKRLQVKGQTTG